MNTTKTTKLGQDSYVDVELLRERRVDEDEEEDEEAKMHDIDGNFDVDVYFNFIEDRDSSNCSNAPRNRKLELLIAT